MISPNLGVAKELPCMRDKASKNCKKCKKEREEKMKKAIIDNVLIAIKVLFSKTYLGSV